MADEQGETIQFFKIRLMEKDREITDYQSKFKKLEIKKTRDLNEANSAADRAKNLLKEEKNKGDRFRKEARESQEQNNLLQMRLVEVKEERDREVGEVRAQYNAIKEEVRGYERILPTLTFLNELGMRIEDIPPYEDIFLSLKEKIVQLEQTNSKFQGYRVKAEELARTAEQNEEMLRNKKMEAEKNLKEVLPKIIEYEHQINDLKINNEEYLNTIDEIREDMEAERDRCQSLEDSIKEYQLRIDQLGQAYSTELHSKQQQIRAITQEEFDRYEQQLKSLQNRLQIKDNMYISQIHILEEQVAFLQGKLQAEKDAFEDHYIDIKEEIDAMRDKIEKEKRASEELQQKHDDAITNLIHVSAINEQLEDRIRVLDRQLDSQNKKENEVSRVLERISSKKIEDLETQNGSLSEKYRILNEDHTKLAAEKDQLLEEISQLRHEISMSSHETKDNSKPDLLDIPAHLLQYDEQRRRKSIDLDKQETELILLSVEKNDIVRERRRTMEVSKQMEEVEREKDEYKRKLDEYAHEVAKLLERQKETDNKRKEEGLLLDKTSKQLVNFKREREKFIEDSIQMKEKIVMLTKTINDHQKTVSGSSTKQNLQKTQIESMQEEMKILQEEAKKDKDIIKTLRDELKQQRDVSQAFSERTAKEIKELTAQIESTKQEKDRVKNESASKQKGLSHELALLKNGKQLQDKLREQISSLRREAAIAEQQRINQEKISAQQSRQIQKLQTKIEDLQEKLKEKERENSTVVQSLERERKERALRTVPSLHSIQGDDAEQQTFSDIYATITQKQGEINILHRQLSDVKQEIDSLKIVHANRLEAMEAEQADYIQTIIEMKMRCAESEMRASEKQFMYSQLKKKMGK